MPSGPAFVGSYSKLSGHPVPFVTGAARALDIASRHSEAVLWTLTKQGRGAKPQTEPSHMLNLMVATSGIGQVKDGAEYSRHFGALVPQRLRARQGIAESG